jgi:hypothetical protein
MNCCKTAKNLITYNKKQKQFILMYDEDYHPGQECYFIIDYCPYCGVRLDSLLKEEQ